MPRTQGIELFVRDGISEQDPFPLEIHDLTKLSPIDLLWKTTEERFEITVFKTSVITRSSVGMAYKVSNQQ
jgi:hypothetical protein